MAVSIMEKLRGDLTDYKPIPFWSWNDELEPEHLRRQIRDMKKAGIGGFFMHARGGLTTEYLGEDWFKCVGASVDEAEKQGMRAWAYDENGWPSGFAGMKLLEDKANHAHYIVCRHADAFDPKALGCYRVEDGELVRLTDDDGSPCECVYDMTNDSVVDILNWKIVRAFIEETHEKYNRRFAKQFGNVLMGFFTDEPQYFRYETAYSPVMPGKYRSKYSSDMLEELGALFLDCRQAPRFRYRYWLTMNELYTEAFAGQIYRWCTEHNCKLTGHTIDENSLFGQMMCSGGVMPFYEYEHIPGIDWLCRITGNEMAPRQVSSVAMQLGKPQVLTETFAACGWGVTPRELKRIAEWQYVHGVNLMCHHLYPYSIRGQRKRDYPAFYSPHNPWTRDLKHFNDYFTRVGYMLSQSREIADTLIIHPIHSAYLTFRRNDRSTLKKLNDDFVNLVEGLSAVGIIHHYADESLLKKYGSIKNGKLVVGKCAYSNVVVPDMPCIDESTLSLLTEFVKAGGKLCFAGEQKPHLVDGEERSYALESNIAIGEITNHGFSLRDAHTDIRITVRKAEFGDFVYAVNTSKDWRQTNVFHINAKGARKFNPERPGFEPLYFRKLERGIDIPLELEPGESTIIFLSSLAESAPAPDAKSVREFLKPEAIIENMDDNCLTLDTAALSYDGESYTGMLPVMAISDRMLREGQNRTIYLKYCFNVTAKPAIIKLETEKWEGAELTLNGVRLERDLPGALDFSFRAADISKLLRTGKNELIVRLDYYQREEVYKIFKGVYVEPDGTTESKLNCLSYDTDIEAVYIRGDFCLDEFTLTEGENGTLSSKGGFSITLPRKYVNLSELAEEGFPFFGGSMSVRTIIPAKGDESIVRLKGNYCTARVSINGGKERLIMFSDSVNVAGELKKGDNEIRITLTNSLRNTLGDFHASPNPEPEATSPDSFTHYGNWRDGRCEGYTDDYSFVKFGIESIELQ
ncbi:MAG: hypothetical protein II920_09805 [Clostridia bacterium]|nr:hypothetical protein [Clostridia bacterium]